MKMTKKMCSLLFLTASTLLVLTMLGLQFYTSSFVYVVLLDDLELGTVEDAEEIELFVSSLTARCGELYGMSLEPGEKIALIKEFRPDCKPAPDIVQRAIRQQISFKTIAYLIKVNGEDLVPVASAEVLDEVVDSLKEMYSSESGSARLIDVYILEDLDLDERDTPLDEIFTAEEVVTLLTENDSEQSLLTLAKVESYPRSTVSSRHSFDSDKIIPPPIIREESEQNSGLGVSAINDIKIRVITTEEITVLETIPFEIEFIESEDRQQEQNEIETPGIDGLKEIIYHITRENGIEIEQTLISEIILEEPVTQVVTIPPDQPQAKAVTQSQTRPTIKPLIKTIPKPQIKAPTQLPTKSKLQSPSLGTDRFVWPVQGQGIIYPGRGFSSSHTGIDIHIDHGTNVLAADSGVVWFSGYGSTQGNYLIIHHGRYWTLYLHNSAHLVSKGDRVSKGQVIARVGTTGRAIGAHLHFEVRVDDGTGKWNSYYQHKPVDPLQFYNRRE